MLSLRLRVSNHCLVPENNTYTRGALTLNYTCVYDATLSLHGRRAAGFLNTWAKRLSSLLKIPTVFRLAFLFIAALQAGALAALAAVAALDTLAAVAAFAALAAVPAFLAALAALAAVAAAALAGVVLAVGAATCLTMLRSHKLMSSVVS